MKSQKTKKSLRSQIESTDEVLSLDSQLCFALYSASRLLVQAYQSLLEPFDLTYTQYLVMLSLDSSEGLTVKQMGEKLMLDSGTLSPLLKKMEGKGLVRRQTEPEDERVVRIQLTQAGRKLRSQLPCVPIGIAEKFSGEMSLERVRDLREGLRDLIARLTRYSGRMES